MPEAAVVAERVSKWYPPRAGRPSLARAVRRWLLGRPVASPPVPALRDVTFAVAAGESLGIVGPNGAGKSTLLRILAGIMRPSSGTVTVSGRVASQLGPGAAFGLHLTGRATALLQGTIHGMTNREVRQLLPQMIEFAGLETVVDAPLQTYSSGMIARLAFAIAAQVPFDVLLLDEAVTAGDLDFRTRCRATLAEFRRIGRTLVLASHGIDGVRRLCDRVLWLEGGQVRALGPVDEVMSRYAQAARLPRDRAAPRALSPRPRGVAPLE